jgi:hypothetical protein
VFLVCFLCVCGSTPQVYASWTGHLARGRARWEKRTIILCAKDRLRWMSRKWGKKLHRPSTSVQVYMCTSSHASPLVSSVMSRCHVGHSAVKAKEALWPTWQRDMTDETRGDACDDVHIYTCTDVDGRCNFLPHFRDIQRRRSLAHKIMVRFSHRALPLARCPVQLA